jgi:hypothetical protein
MAHMPLFIEFRPLFQKLSLILYQELFGRRLFLTLKESGVLVAPSSPWLEES